MCVLYVLNLFVWVFFYIFFCTAHLAYFTVVNGAIQIYRERERGENKSCYVGDWIKLHTSRSLRQFSPCTYNSVYVLAESISVWLCQHVHEFMLHVSKFLSRETLQSLNHLVCIGTECQYKAVIHLCTYNGYIVLWIYNLVSCIYSRQLSPGQRDLMSPIRISDRTHIFGDVTPGYRYNLSNLGFLRVLQLPPPCLLACLLACVCVWFMIVITENELKNSIWLLVIVACDSVTLQSSLSPPWLKTYVAL